MTTTTTSTIDPTALVAARQKLLQQRLETVRSGNLQQPRIPRLARQTSAPLSFAQQRLWFLDQLQPGNSAYNLFDAWRLSGPLRVDLLERAFSQVLQRHEILRTSFATVQDQPMQTIGAAREFTLEKVDLRSTSAADREQRLQRALSEAARRPFSLTQDLLLRAHLFALDENEHVLLVNMHHIVSDAWSLGVLYHEINHGYAALSGHQSADPPELPVQYADFASWQREFLTGDALNKNVSFWKQQLAGAPGQIELPADHSRPAQQSFLGALEMLSLPESLGRELKALSRREGVTLFMTLLAAFNTLLHRYSRQTDLVIGTPVAGRNQPETEDLIGFFVNTLPLRTDVSDDPPFHELLQRVRQTVLDLDAHQEVPFEKLVIELQAERNSSQSPLFHVMFILQGLSAHPPQLPGVTATQILVDNGTSKFDLSLVIFEGRDTLTAAIEYNRNLFEQPTMERMLRHYQTLLADIVARPNSPLSRLRLLDESERQQLMVQWNQTASPYPKELTFVQLFEAQVQRTPEAIALVVGQQQLSYAQLNARTNQLAHRLRSLGIGPESLVGICCERNLDMLIGMLAVLKAGGAYLPMDPNYPAERLAFMLQDAKAPLLLTQEKFKDRFSGGASSVESLDTLDVSAESSANPPALSRPNNLAYVIYTSGSTGQPKGVALEQRSLNAFAHWAKEQFTQEELDGVLAGTSICFDLSVFELLVPLCWGGKVILAQNVLELPELPAASQVRLINTVPSAAAELLRINGIPKDVQVVNLAGEPLRQSLVDQLYQLGTVKKVYDLYGPTEDTVYSTCALRTPKGKATIGRPLANKQVYILDEQMEPVPVGVVGQLYIGGDGLARGYLHRPELTAERFIEHNGQRLYKTGDLARYQADGNIEFLGRADHQVKIRGFRIELGEIEAQLRQHPHVRDGIVVAREDNGEKRLVAYVVANSEITTTDLRDYFKKRLPEYMVPGIIMLLPELPRTANGKINHKELPAPDTTALLAEQFVAPETEIENLLAKIWSEILGLKSVGIHDNFFQLGGHSLMITRLISRVREAIQVELPMASVFEAPTIAELALMLEDILIREIDELAEGDADVVDGAVVEARAS